MAAAPRRWAAELLHFWFQRMRPGQWFGCDAAADEQLRRRFAREHYRMVARFGRFPHRNAALGRRSAPAELRAIAAENVW